MFGADSKTSSTTLKWAMTELMQNPVVMRKRKMKSREHSPATTR